MVTSFMYKVKTKSSQTCIPSTTRTGITVHIQRKWHGRIHTKSKCVEGGWDQVRRGVHSQATGESKAEHRGVFQDGKRQQKVFTRASGSLPGMRGKHEELVVY